MEMAGSRIESEMIFILSTKISLFPILNFDAMGNRQQDIQWQRFLWLVPGCWLLMPNFAQAQITSDGTLGTTVNLSPSLACNSGICAIAGGTTDSTGKNLFHSFQDFSIPPSTIASFNNTASIQNIISRVTGTNASTINGTIQANSSANVFLINPNGIVFTPSAYLNIGGSFVATTANSIQFGNTGSFGATTGNSVATLTVNPSAFFYNQIPQPIVNQGYLQVSAGNSLVLAGGDIAINGGQLYAPGGRVELAGLAAPGQIGLNIAGTNFSLNPSPSITLANVSLTDAARVSAISGGGGSIAVNAQNLNLWEGSIMVTGIAPGMGSSSAAAGDITINATNTVTLADNSIIVNDISTNGIGNGGKININTGLLIGVNGSIIGNNIFGTGNAGEINIQASNLVLFDGAKDDFNSGIYSAVLPKGVGNGGNINIATRSLLLTNGGQLQATTTGYGNAGNINVQASDSVIFDGVGNHNSVTNTGIGDASGAYSAVLSGAVGNGGNISITAESLLLSNRGVIITSSLGQGDAGNIDINASGQVLFQGVLNSAQNSQSDNNLTLSGLNADDTLLTGAFSTVFFGAQGNAGNIQIGADSLELNKGAGISVSNGGEGDGGNLQVQVDEIVVLNELGFITARTRQGGGGNINLQAGGVLVMVDNSIISATSGGSSDGGNITINVPFILTIPASNSDINANAFMGRGGNINITTQGVFGFKYSQTLTSSSDIIANSLFGANGTIKISLIDADFRPGLIALPNSLIKVEGLARDGCQAALGGDRHRFIIAGKGGLPPSPYEAMGSDSLAVNWVILGKGENASIPPKVNGFSFDLAPNSATKNQVSSPVVEAQGWWRNEQGQIVLAAEIPAIAPRAGLQHNSWQKPRSCSQ
jgi:filamentous hemagglutinin family protein